MDFSLTNLFVTDSGTVATANSTQDLTAKQLGIFLPTYAVATAGNVTTAKYIYVAQGRVEVVPGVGSKRSDKIAKANIIDWYKVVAEADVAQQITDISALDIQCGQEITFAFRLHSSYIDAAFFNGLTHSVVVRTACCECADDPCTDLDPEATIDAAIAKLLSEPLNVSGIGNATLASFLNFERVGTGVSSILRVSGKPLTEYTNAFDVAAYPFQHDRLWFRAFVVKGPMTTQDFIVDDVCDNVATIQVKQRATFGRGSDSEIRQLEKNFYSYQAGMSKHLFREGGWNGEFESYVTDGVFYDLYVIKFSHYKDQMYNWASYVPLDSTVIIALPTGQGSALEAILEAFIGEATPNKSGVAVTTTTTTSTTSTTTTSTTTLFP